MTKVSPLTFNKIERHSKTFKLPRKNPDIKTGSAYKFLLTLKSYEMTDITGPIDF